MTFRSVLGLETLVEDDFAFVLTLVAITFTSPAGLTGPKPRTDLTALRPLLTNPPALTGATGRLRHENSATVT